MANALTGSHTFERDGVIVKLQYIHGFKRPFHVELKRNDVTLDHREFYTALNRESYIDMWFQIEARKQESK
jgi:hypothetical protein